MTSIDSYYGNIKDWRTYLEIYSKKNKSSTRQIHRQLTDQEAYDAWHLSFYLKEVLSYKRLLEKKNISFDQIPRKEKNLLVYLALLVLGKKTTVLELGQSLYELIDGLEVVKRYFDIRKIKEYSTALLKNNYIGIDLSDDLCLTAKILHPQYNVLTYNSVDSLKKPFDLLYDRNVSSYAFTTSEDLAQFMNKSNAAIMNLFLSKKSTFYSTRLGKTLTYFSLADLVSHLKLPLFHLFGEKAPGPFAGDDLARGHDVVEGFFLLGSNTFATSFMSMAERKPEIKKYFTQKHIALRPALSLL